MNALRRCIAAAAMALLAPLGLAQGQIIVDQGPLNGGGRADVTYTNPGMPGKEIEIEVTGVDASGGVHVETIPVQLDGDGKGSFEWEVPSDWVGVNFNGPDAHEETRPIE